jgi:hypothetical protein
VRVTDLRCSYVTTVERKPWNSMDAIRLAFTSAITERRGHSSKTSFAATVSLLPKWFQF